MHSTLAYMQMSDAVPVADVRYRSQMHQYAPSCKCQQFVAFQKRTLSASGSMVPWSGTKRFRNGVRNDVPRLHLVTGCGEEEYSMLSIIMAKRRLRVRRKHYY
ncbi:hypothetical protein O6H91_Y225800 [Diphasiastrum complanatum]|nr:hypothetical protein O6H91_Y225800 [Diphasiastrum complanatum]